MSTLTIFLCAAAFFTAQTIASSENQEKDVVIREIDQAIEKIDASAKQAFRQITKIGHLDGGTLHNDIMKKYKNEASRYIRSLDAMVEQYLNYGQRLSQQEKDKCLIDFNAYKNEFYNIVQHNGHFGGEAYDALYYIALACGDLLHMASENKIALENLKLRVNVGNTTEWNNIIENARNISTHFLAVADKVLQFNKGVEDGTSIETIIKFETYWDEYLNKGMDAIRKLYDCAHPRSRLSDHAVRGYHGLFSYL